MRIAVIVPDIAKCVQSHLHQFGPVTILDARWGHAKIETQMWDMVIFDDGLDGLEFSEYRLTAMAVSDLVFVKGFGGLELMVRK